MVDLAGAEADADLMGAGPLLSGPLRPAPLLSFRVYFPLYPPGDVVILTDAGAEAARGDWHQLSYLRLQHLFCSIGSSCHLHGSSQDFTLWIL